MKISIIQLQASNIEDYKITAEHIYEMISTAAENKPDFIVLPECSFPSYMLEIDPEIKNAAIDYSEIVEEKLCKLAEKYSVYIIFGIAEKNNFSLSNSVIAINKRGKIVSRSSKSNLWHFDYKSFKQGEEFPIIDTEFGKIGMMVCADGRIPEIARILTIKGAKIIFDVVNLVTNAWQPEQMDNQQHLFMLKSRAKENGIYIVVCNKCGIESSAVTYLGRSFVVNPNGEIIAELGPEKEEILHVNLTIDNAEERNKKLELRKPQLYNALLSKGITQNHFRKYYTLIAQFCTQNEYDYWKLCFHFLNCSQIMDAKICFLPEFSGLLSDQSLLMLKDTEKKVDIISCADKENFYIVNEKTLIRKSRYKYADYKRIDICQLSDELSVGMLSDEEIEIPEISRCMMLMGANLFFHYDSRECSSLDMLRTRAAENKVFVVSNFSCLSKRRSVLISPDGAILMTTLDSDIHAGTGYINLSLANDKDVVPGTNIIDNRIPEYYKELL